MPSRLWLARSRAKRRFRNRRGPASGGGAGTGTGTGVGSGQGSGLGPGFGGGTGGGAYRPGAGVTIPRVIREVKPNYTADAMRAKVQGIVLRRMYRHARRERRRSQDRPIPRLGLRARQEAMKAAKQWKFQPGMRHGEPVPVIVTIELTFTLR